MHRSRRRHERPRAQAQSAGYRAEAGQCLHCTLAVLRHLYSLGPACRKLPCRYLPAATVYSAKEGGNLRKNARLSKNSLKFQLSTFPIWHDTFEQVNEGRPVVTVSNVTKL